MPPTPAIAKFNAPNLVGAPALAHRLVRALRVEGIAHGAGEDPRARLNDLFHTPEAVNAFRLLVAGMAHVWPEPLALFRPCCPALTHDEACLLTLVQHAATANRRAFDAAISEMIGQDAREWLYGSTVRLAEAL
jgi:hypothetical protein